jgi:hypothetical protein
VTDRSRHDPLEDRLEAWLAGLPDVPPDALAGNAAARARSKQQRPAWLASIRQRSGFAGSVWRPLPVLVATLAVVALIVIAAPFVGRQLTGPGATPTTSPATAPPASPTAAPPSPASPSSSGPPALVEQATRQIPLDRTPTAVGTAFESLWVTNLDGELLRIDPASGETIATIALGAAGCGPIQADAFALWLQTCGSSSTIGPEAASTIRIDPDANAVADRYEDGEPDGVGIGTMRGLVWFISDLTTLTGVTAESGAPVRTIDVPGPVRHLTAGLGSLWISPIGEPSIVRIDPESGDELARISLSGDSGFLAASGDAVWVAEPHQWLIGRIDPVANALAGEYIAAPVADQIVFDAGGRVWLLAHDTLMAFDPDTGRELARYAVPAHDTVDGIEAMVLAADADGIWYGAPDALWFIPTD